MHRRVHHTLECGKSLGCSQVDFGEVLLGMLPVLAFPIWLAVKRAVAWRAELQLFQCIEELIQSPGKSRTVMDKLPWDINHAGSGFHCSAFHLAVFPVMWKGVLSELGLVSARGFLSAPDQECFVRLLKLLTVGSLMYILHSSKPQIQIREGLKGYEVQENIANKTGWVVKYQWSYLANFFLSWV